MKRISIIVLSVMMVCLSVFSVSAVDYNFDAETVSDAVYLENLDAGVVVYEKNSDQKMFPASTTKIMTFIITAENVSDLDKTYVTIKQDVIDGLDPESTVMGLSSHIGEQVSVRDLLYGLMLPSGNDAALALADYVGGGIPGFAEKMNAKAAELGCKNTHFANPHGLSDSDHYTTAHDMALIAKHAMTIPDFMEICNTVYYTPEGFATLHNTNYMIDKEAEGGKYYYEYTKGIKTGYLDEAGKCLVTSSDKNGEKYICVCLGAAYSYDENVNYAMLDTAKLYELAYKNLGIQTIYNSNNFLASVDVNNARDEKSLSVVPEKPITAFLPNNYNKEKLQVTVNCPDQVEAPVKKGDVLGTVSVKYEDLDLGETNLLAAEDVARIDPPAKEKSTESKMPMFILAAAAALVIILRVILLLVLSARKRRRARQRSRSYRGRRFRD